MNLVFFEGLKETEQTLHLQIWHQVNILGQALALVLEVEIYFVAASDDELTNFKKAMTCHTEGAVQTNVYFHGARD